MKNKTPATVRKYAFSLVELLVAIGMLVVMMGFLFQFVIGSQRIWSASNRNASVFTDAQLVFSLLERDMHNAMFQYSDEFPGRDIPMYLEDDGTNFSTLYLISTIVAPTNASPMQEKVGYYPIIYSLELDLSPPLTPPLPTTPYILYRDVIDQDFTPPTDPRPFAYFGSDEDSLPSAWSAASTRQEILCRNIKALKISAMPAPNVNGKFISKPKAVKVTLTLYEPLFGKNENATYPERIFNKIIFLK